MAHQTVEQLATGVLMAGISKWRAAIEFGATAEEIAAGWQDDESRFLSERASCLLYE